MKTSLWPYVLLAAAGIVLLAGLTQVAATAAGVQKKLIEFGWDEPDPDFMRKHYREMEQTPFDGCVFHVNYAGSGGVAGSFTWECWGRREFRRGELAQALADLRATPFRRFRHNFLRFNVTPGDVDWFDDFKAILGNARLAARVAREGRCDGILLDIEQYKSPLFDYHAQPGYGTKTWPEYAAKVRERGREIMEAFQAEFPDIRLMLTYGYELPWEEGRKGGDALQNSHYSLLAPFLDGLIQGIRGKARLIDGYERSYGYILPDEFNRGYAEMKQGVLPLVADRQKYNRVTSRSFGLWLDYNWRTLGWNPAGIQNYRNPEQFEMSVRSALKTADEYVWIYSETPRWWSTEGGTVSLPESYKSALYRASGRRKE